MVQIIAREVGRKLELVLGDEGDDEAPRIVVPPVPSSTGSVLFAKYNQILFARSPVNPEVVAEEATRIALGAWTDDPDLVDDEERARRQARWDAVQALRWDEGEMVCQAALYWNIQGGGIEVVRLLLKQGVNDQGEALGGPAKAQEAILRRANLWTAYSRLMTLLNSGADDRTPEPDASSATSTPAGTSPSASASDSAA